MEIVYIAYYIFLYCMLFFYITNLKTKKIVKIKLKNLKN